MLTIPAFLAVSLCLCAADEPQVLKGEVTSVIDGDGLRLKTEDGTEYQIQLNGIDAPEREQPFSQESRKALEKKLKGKTVEVRWTEKDRFERVLGDVYLGEELINETQVLEGFAWHFKRYSKSETLAKAETAAREKKAGLWSQDNPEAPWDYRAKNRKKSS
jgi:micrococcal nuclease